MGITEEEGQKHLLVLLNILHFKTKHNFYTPRKLPPLPIKDSLLIETVSILEQYNELSKNPEKPRRHNRGPSLVHEDIISTASLSSERGALPFLLPLPNPHPIVAHLDALLLANLLSDASVANSYEMSEQVGKGGFGRVFGAKSPIDASQVRPADCPP